MAIKLSINLIFNYFNLLMCKQSSVLLAKLKPRHYLMSFIPLLSIVVINLLTSSIYSNMISPPKQWCKTLECFSQSNIKFVTFDPDLQDRFLTIKKDQHFKSILSRTTLHSRNSEFSKSNYISEL